MSGAVPGASGAVTAPAVPRALLAGVVAVGLVLAVVLVAAAVPASAQSGAVAPRPPGQGPDGTATLHGDAWSTDTLPGRGPGAAPTVTGLPTGSTCSSVFVGGDGMPVALCTAYLGLTPPTPLAPTVVVFDPATGAPLAQVQLAKGTLLGGVYGYLDDRDRVVVADGNRRLLAVGHERDPGPLGSVGAWRMRVDVLAELDGAVPAGDAVTGLGPGFDGRVWFATSGGVVGTVRPGEQGSVHTLALPPGERITNGLTVREGGASILTTRALYEVDSGSEGTPTIRWRRGYAGGPARKPGLLAYGSGTTPTYFGTGAVPDSGGAGGLVAITDDAVRPELVVYRRADGSEVCRMPAFATTEDPSSAAADGTLIRGPAATENSIIATGDALVLVNTYGFQYPPFAVDGPSVPDRAAYTGGMTRVDVSGAGCRRAWTSTSRTASLPKLTRDDRLVHALAYGPIPQAPGSAEDELGSGFAQKAGPVFFTSTDVETGREVARDPVGVAPVDEPMELTGTIAPGPGGAPVAWQPTLARMLRIAG